MKLSVLDLVPMWNGQTASAAIRESVALAQHVERLGYSRYWFAEHHNTAWQASSAPELLIGHVAAATTTLRVGSGGVMLPNHSPLKVAENFRTLEALYPGRIDLGLGRAPGTDGMTALALRRSRQALLADDWDEQMAELLGFLRDGLPADHRFSGIAATPVVETWPELWVLGSSTHGGAFAAEHGLGFAFAHHIAPDLAVPVLQAYRRDFRPSAWLREPRSMLATLVFAADSDAAAEDTAALVELFRMRLGRGPLRPPTLDEAREYRTVMAQRGVPSIAATHTLTGAIDRVAAKLRDLATAAGAAEVMALTFATDADARRRSYALLGEAFELRPAGADRMRAS